MKESDFQKVKYFIDEHRKSMSWYQRTKQDIKSRYLGYKFRFQDWINK